MKKKIMLLIKGLDRGGAERLVVDMLRHRDPARFDYEVAYLLNDHDALVEDIRAMGVPVHPLGSAPTPAWPLRLARLVRRRGADLVHVHSPHTAIGARLALRGPRRPVLLYTEHLDWGGYRRLTYWGNLLTYPLNDRVLTVSDYVRGSVRYPGVTSRLPMPPMETLYHGVDSEVVAAQGAVDGVREELGIPPEAPVVGCVANFRAQKDHGVLLRAAAILRHRIPDVRLVLVGGGPLEDEVRSRVHRMGLDRSVVFTGPRADAVRIMGAFDVFGLTSLQEGLSIALLEAMALGKPVVVTDVGGMNEAVQDGMGILVPPGDPRRVAEALEAVLTDDALRQRMGDAARRRALHFDVREATERIEQVYTELLS